MIIDILTSWWFIGMIGLAIGFIVGLICLDFKHSDGVIHVTRGEERDTYLFEFNVPPERVPQMKNVIFSVRIEPKEQNLQSP